jgi:hypothetical protein
MAIIRSDELRHSRVIAIIIRPYTINFPFYGKDNKYEITLVIMTKIAKQKNK